MMNNLGPWEAGWLLATIFGTLIWGFNAYDARKDLRAMIKTEANGLGRIHADVNIFGSTVMTFFQLVFLGAAIRSALLPPPAPTIPEPSHDFLLDVGRVLVLIGFILVEVAIIAWGIKDRLGRKAIVAYSLTEAEREAQKAKEIEERNLLRDTSRDAGRDPVRDADRDEGHDKALEQAENLGKNKEEGASGTTDRRDHEAS